VWANELLARVAAAPERARSSSSLLWECHLLLRVYVDDSAGGQGFPRLVEPRFFVQVRKIERWRMIAAVTPRRLVEGQGMGQTQEERHWRCGTDSGGMKMTRRGVRCCSALSGSGYHRVGPIRCSSPKYCQYIVGSTTGTILYRLGAILRQQFYNLVMSLL
jgi:hypothetical protein